MIFTHEKRLINPDLYKQELKKMTTLRKWCYRKADMVVNFKSEPEPSFPLSSKSHYSTDGKGERTGEKWGNAVCVQQPRSDWPCVSYHVKHQETFFCFCFWLVKKCITYREFFIWCSLYTKMHICLTYRSQNF